MLRQVCSGHCSYRVCVRQILSKCYMFKTFFCVEDIDMHMHLLYAQVYIHNFYHADAGRQALGTSQAQVLDI